MTGRSSKILQVTLTQWVAYKRGICQAYVLYTMQCTANMHCLNDYTNKQGRVFGPQYIMLLNTGDASNIGLITHNFLYKIFPHILPQHFTNFGQFSPTIVENSQTDIHTSGQQHGYIHRVCREYELDSFLQQYEIEQVAATCCNIQPSTGIVVRDWLSVHMCSWTMIHNLVRMISETELNKHQPTNKSLPISNRHLS